MLRGVNGQPYLDLSPLVNTEDFEKLHPYICRSFAKAKHLSSQSSLDVPDGFFHLDVYKDANFKPLWKGYREYCKLSDTDPIKLYSKDLSENELATYLKYVTGGYDLYQFYVLCDFQPGWRTTPFNQTYKAIAEFFPEVVTFINSLVQQKIFYSIGRASFFVQEAGGISFEHKDPAVDPENPEIMSEFIYFRPNLNRPFYVRNSSTFEKTYINTTVAYWNDQDYHGGDTVLEPSYSFRVDGVFTKEFKEKINELYY